jgi:BlaI family transcriptional regulator, penicillinase repressor
MPPKFTPVPPRPTDAELAILRVIWARGPGSVREILEGVNERRNPPLAYTTVLRFLQIMTEKGLVEREEGDRGHIYRPSVPAQKTKRQLVGDLLHRVFDGSVRELVLQALGTKKVSAADAREIRKLLDDMEP